MSHLQDGFQRHRGVVLTVVKSISMYRMRVGGEGGGGGGGGRKQRIETTNH